MAGKSTKGIKATANTTGAGGAATAGGKEVELDFNDTITRNRNLPLVEVGAVPEPPVGFRGTDPLERGRRVRWLSGELRSEAADALREGGKRDLKAELGPFAQEPARALVLADRVVHTGDLVTAAEALLAYAREVDQIAMSDALTLLEALQKQYLNAVEHNAGLATKYKGLVKLFAMRSGAISDGIAQSQAQAKASKEAVVVTAAVGEPAAKGASK